MVETKIGTAVLRQNLSPILSMFRLMPEPGNRFPDYEAGQYIALRRNNCRMTKRIIGPNGEKKFIPDLDPSGNQKRGPVTHSYSISSAPYETTQEGYLEFYVILEFHETGEPGRLTDSLFRIDPHEDNKVTYFCKIVGDFTLDSRAAGFKNVIFVGTGSGLAPFASMIKQVHYEALNGRSRDVKYTLFHANRTYEELGYHQKFLEIESAGKIDFAYVPSVSRPTQANWNDPDLGKGRANNMLRSVLGMPMKEEQDLEQAESRGKDASTLKSELEKAVRPTIPQRHSKKLLQERIDLANSVFLTCGNARAMADIKFIAEENKIRFEKEDW